MKKHGIDYDETFSKMLTVFVLLAVVAAKWWQIHQMDVRNAIPQEVLEIG